MMKNLQILLLSIISIGVSAQYVETFEDATTFELGGQGFDNQITVTAEAGPAGGDNSATAMKIVENPTVRNWHYAIVYPTANGVRTNFMKAGGNFINLWFYPGEAGTGTFGLGLKAPAGGDTVFFEVTYNAATGNEWIQLEFDISTYPHEAAQRIELDHDRAATGDAEGRIAYIDGIRQTTAQVLSTSSIQNINTEIYPNPTTGLLHISDVSDMETLSILNVLGQNVKTVNAASTIDVSDLDNGVYFLSTDNGLTHKFIKE